MKILILLLSICSLSTFAQEAKIIKLKGRKAIIRLPKGHNLSRGDSIDLGGSGASSSLQASGIPKNKNFLALGFSLQNITSSYDTGFTIDSQIFTMSTLYAIQQKKEFEYGVYFNYYSYTFGVAESDYLALGPFLDYNFKPFKAGKSVIVPYARGTVAFVSATEGAESGSGFEFGLSGGGKWFVFAQAGVALELRLYGNSISGTTATRDDSATILGAYLFGYL